MKRHVASEETTSPALPRGPASSREKSIVQQAQERFQGLNWSADGREILQTAHVPRGEPAKPSLKGTPRLLRGLRRMWRRVEKRSRRPRFRNASPRPLRSATWRKDTV